MYKILLSFLLLFLGISQGITQEDCSIFNVVAEAHACENGQFLVDLDLDVNNPGGEQFGVLGNATNYGLFNYADLPITLGPLTGDSETSWEFIIYDLEEPSCQAIEVLGIVDCCIIDITAAVAGDCNDFETYSLSFVVDTANVDGVGFDVFAGNVNLGFFNYSDLSITIPEFPATGDPMDVITICDNDNPTCCDAFEFPAPDCDPTDCEIFNITADTTTCEFGQFFVVLDFDSENTGNSFSVVGNGNDYGNFEYDQLPITLGPFDGNGVTIYEFGISDNSEDNCGGAIAVGPIECPAVCSFNDIEVFPTQCLTDTTYSVDVSFIPINVGDNGFSIYSGDSLLGSFNYANNPVTVDDFPASGNFFDVLTICDNDDPECCETVEFQALICDQCQIYNFDVDLTACNEEGQFFVEVNFDYFNQSDSFLLSGNGMTFGTFSYDSVPVILGPFDADSTTFYELVAFDQGTPLFCNAADELGLVSCLTTCAIEGLQVTPLECTGDNIYSVLIDADPEGTSNPNFDLFFNGEFVGFFAYDELPLEIADFPASGAAKDTVTICDNDNPECCQTRIFNALNCAIECDIFELTVEAIECTSDSTFSGMLNFQYQGFENSTFDVYSGDDFLGIFELDSLPVKLENIPEPVNVNSVITVCENGNQECCQVIEFPGIQCGPVDCDIFELNVDPVECTSDSTYAAFINFGHAGFTSDSFNVFAGDDLLGTFNLADLPVTVLNIPEPANVNSVITVCENDNPECCQTLEFEGMQCEEGVCNIFELVADLGECTSDTTFAATINFQHTGFTNESFDVFSGDELLGTFTLVDLPVSLLNIPTPLNVNSVITVCENDNPECCKTIEFEGLQCGEEECDIFELEVIPQECSGENTYAGILNFQFTGFTNESFDVFAGDDLIGNFNLSELPVTLLNIPSPVNVNSVITVCENDNPECCQTIEFEGLQCEGEECDIFDLVVDPQECTSDSTYSGILNFEYTGFTNGSFDVWAGDEFLGFFSLEELPLTLENIPTPVNVNSVITVCENDNEECCQTIEFAGLQCEGEECDITELSVDVLECINFNTYAAILDFEYVGFSNDGFDVWAGDDHIGFFSLEDLPVTLENIPVPAGTHSLITVCENDNPECCASIEVEAPNCEDECGIFNLVATPTECTSDSVFSVLIDFTYTNLETGGFDFYGDGDYLGTFPVSNIPDIISFPSSGADIAVLTICQRNDTNCCDSVEFEPLNCGSDECDITSLDVDVIECTSDSTYAISVNFTYINAASDQFNVYAGDDLVATIDGTDLPQILNFPTTPGAIDHLTVCNIENNDCCATIEYEGLNCQVGECEIGELNVEVSECNDDGLFFVSINFPHNNTSGEGFSINGNGNQYGTFEYENLPIVIDGLEGDSNTVFEFVVSDLVFDNCSSSIVLGIVDCESSSIFNPGKDITELEVYYSSESTMLRIPESGGELMIFSVDGRVVHYANDLAKDELYEIPSAGEVRGIYFAQYRTSEKIYLGKLLLR